MISHVNMPLALSRAKCSARWQSEVFNLCATLAQASDTSKTVTDKQQQQQNIRNINNKKRNNNSNNTACSTL